jgi:hypothetical protein
VLYEVEEKKSKSFENWEKLGKKFQEFKKKKIEETKEILTKEWKDEDGNLFKRFIFI